MKEDPNSSTFLVGVTSCNVDQPAMLKVKHFDILRNISQFKIF